LACATRSHGPPRAGERLFDVEKVPLRPPHQDREKPRPASVRIAGVSEYVSAARQVRGIGSRQQPCERFEARGVEGTCRNVASTVEELHLHVQSCRTMTLSSELLILTPALRSLLYSMNPSRELVHEEIHARARRADHLRQRLLRNLRHDVTRLRLRAVARKEQEGSRQRFSLELNS